MIKVSSSSIILWGLPVPPSENNAYINSRSGRGRFPSQETKAFKMNMDGWRIANSAMLIGAGKVMACWHSPPRLAIWLGFRHDRVWTRDGRPKKKDAANYIKLLQDGIAAALSIDDSALWGTSVEKAPLGPGEDDEQCLAILTPSLPRTMGEWIGHLGLV